MIKNLIPTHCPACNKPLSIEKGKDTEVIKLMCNNINCIGTKIKKLQKGIIALEIRGLGPAVIEKLLHSGINNSYELFDKEIFNKENLINSGEFKSGRALDKIIASVESVKEIPIDKAILSLQLDNIGKTFSEKLGMIISGVDVDLTGLLISVRDDLEDKSQGIYKEIEDCIKKFEDYGIIIKRYEKPKAVKAKKLSKTVSISDESIREQLTPLGWDIQDSLDVDMHICLDKKDVSEEILESGIKVMTMKQINLLFL